MAGENDNGAATGDTAGTKVDDPTDLQARIDELQKNLDAANERAAKADQARRTAEGTARAAGERVQQSELQTVTTAIDTLKTQAESLEAQYEAADTEGNSRLKASLARQMGRVEAQLVALEAGKQRLEIEAEAAKTAPAVAAIVPGETPAEYLAKQLPPRAAAWIRRNPQYAEGRNYNKMLAAHNLWISDNPGTEETDEYFAAIEKTLGFVEGRPPGASAPAKTAATPEAPLSTASTGQDRGNGATPPPAAPPSRGGGGRNVRLTAEQREAAALSGVSEEEYAKNLSSLKQDGRIH